jgi:hypothetical protein
MLFKFGRKYNSNGIKPYTSPINKLGRSFQTLRVIRKEIQDIFIKKYNLSNYVKNNIIKDV